MKYCIPFNRDSKQLNSVQEIIIDYTPNKSEMRLQSFIDMYPDQRITLDLSIVPPTKELIAAVANLRKGSNFAIRFDKQNAAALEAFPKLGVIWYLTNAAMTYDDIFSYKILGASEFFISAQQGFDLPHIKFIADSLDMKVRSIYAYGYEDVEIYKPYWQYFIRPEDVALYGQYIDTIEFYGDPFVVNVLVSAYQAGKWNGPLNEIIPTQKVTYDSRYIVPYWGRRRVQCNRQCMYGGSCTMCEAMKDLSDTLEKAQIIIPPEIRGAKTEQIIIDESALEKPKPKIKPNF